jgi:hypothetical protein
LIKTLKPGKSLRSPPELTLVSGAKLELVNSEARFKFVSLEYLHRLVDRILEGIMVTQLFGESRGSVF